MSHYRLFILVLLGVLLSHSGWAQSLIFRHYTSEHGLPSSEIRQVIQDQRGYIWLATDKGVSCFDGYQFTNKSSAEGLCGNRVVSLHPVHGEKHPIWMQYRSGKWCQFVSNHFHYAHWIDSLETKTGGSFNSACFVSDQDAWFGRQGGTILVHWRDGAVKKLLTAPLKGTRLAVWSDDASEPVLGVGQANLRGPLELVWVRNNRPDQHIILSQDPVSQRSWHAARSNDKGIALCGGDRFILVEEDGTTHSYNLGFEADGPIMQDRSGNWWISTANDGVRLFRTEYDEAIPSSSYLPGVSVTSMLEDREGGLWFSTRENGVYYLASTLFRSYTQEDGLARGKVRALASNNDTLFTATSAGMLQAAFTDPTGKQQFKLLAMLPTIYDLVWDQRSGLWIASEGGLFQFRETLVQHSEAACHSVLPLKNGLLACGHEEGLILFDHNSSTIVDSIPASGTIQCMLERPDGSMILGSTEGLFSLKSRTVIPLKDRSNALTTEVSALALRNETLFAATMGAGILRIQNGKVTRINTSNELASNLCSDLLPGLNDRLWVATNSGISALHWPDTAKLPIDVQLFSNYDGLLSNEVNRLQGLHGSLWAASSRGLTSFPADRAYQQVPPLVYINKISINNEVMDRQRHYELKADQNNLVIDYVGLCFRDPAAVTYQIKMIGEDLDTNWRSTSATSIQFNPLPYGSYEFTLSAKDKRGTWAANPVTMSFYIRAPYWRTWWFISTVLLSIISVLWSIFYIRLIMLKRQNLLLQKAFESEQKALRSQMTPHFIFNSLNSIQLLVASNNRIDALKNLSKFSKLMRKILQNSKKPSVPLIEELETLELYIELENLRFQNTIEYQLQVDDSIDAEVAEIPPMLIQPYVENAIWHGLMNKEEMGGRVEIRIEDKDTMLVCSITDNGVGRKKAMELNGKNPDHQSSGMIITKERLMILNATRRSTLNVRVTDLSDKEGIPTGTKVEIFIPN